MTGDRYDNNRYRRVTKDGARSAVNAFDEFIDKKYAAPLDEVRHLEERRAEALAKEAAVDLQRQAQDNLKNSQTYIAIEIPSNVAEFTALGKELNQQAEWEAKKQAENINKLGFDVTIHEFTLEGGAKSFDVEALMPEKYKDRDPLTMQIEELKDAQKEAKEERSGDKVPGSSFKPVDMEKILSSQSRSGEALAS